VKEQVYVDRLFADYEQTLEIRDFKEEIVANLKERIRELKEKGESEDSAFEKATEELGDVMAIADEVGKKKRAQTLGEIYMGEKVAISKRTAAGFAAATGLLMLGAGVALVSVFGDWNPGPLYAAAAIIPAGLSLFTYFGLTRETAAHYPMKQGRAMAYAAFLYLGVLGAALATASFVAGGWELTSSLILKVALILPAICALVFLLATETKRQKPWVKALAEEQGKQWMATHQSMVDPVKAARFGVASGGLWLLAIGVFLTLTLLADWPYAFLVFIFTLAIQVFMVMFIFKKKEEIQ
jgi:MFS family permease